MSEQQFPQWFEWIEPGIESWTQYIRWDGPAIYAAFHADGSPQHADVGWELQSMGNSWRPIPTEPEAVRQWREQHEFESAPANPRYELRVGECGRFVSCDIQVCSQAIAEENARLRQRLEGQKKHIERLEQKATVRREQLRGLQRLAPADQTETIWDRDFRAALHPASSMVDAHEEVVVALAAMMADAMRAERESTTRGCGLSASNGLGITNDRGE